MKIKIINIISIILLLFVGFVAMTDEPVIVPPEVIPNENDFRLLEADEDHVRPVFSQSKPARWFKSNSGGLAINEIKSRIIALRNEYALSVESAYPDEIPVYLQEFYKEEYSIEVRTLFKNARRNRVQWLLRDDNNITRLIAVIFESVEEKIVPAVKEEAEKEAEKETEKEAVENPEVVEVTAGETEAAENTAKEELVNTKETRIDYIERKTGFIEVYDEESNLINEYTYYKNGYINKINFEYNENTLIKASSYKSEQDDEEKYVRTFTDSYFYNRSLSLRTIERIFHIDMQAKDNDIAKISFPRNIRDISNNDMLINERLNLYPDFFGEVYIEDNSKMIFDIDNRGRVLKQTLYNDKDEVIWFVTNTWKNNRIILAEKTEGDLILSAEYAYNLAGDKISEKNYNNGVLERTVEAEGNLEIEELYMNNVVVLRAIWEEGIKISETRVK